MGAKKQILMFGHAGSQNRGCEAIVRSTSSLLKEICGPDVFIRVSSRARQEDLAASIPSVDAFMGIGNPWPAHSLMRRIHAGLEWRLEKIKPGYRVAIDNLRAIGCAPRADVGMAVGGDLYCYDTAHYNYPLQRVLRFFCRRMVLWGCSIEPDRIDRPMLKDLRRFDLITARESITEEALRNQGLVRVRRYPDPAFRMEAELLPLPEGWRNGQMVGLNVSPLIESFERQRGGALAACFALVQQILDTSDMGVLLVPHVTWHYSDDRIPLGQIHEAFRSTGRVLMLPDGLNAPKIKGYISRCRFFIGARTHATIAAYSTGVPTLVLGYSVKARGIARDLLGAERGLVLPVQDLSDARILVHAFGELREREPEIRAQLAAIIPAHLQAARDAGREIQRMLNE